jgi:hypothetical protein
VPVAVTVTPYSTAEIQFIDDAGYSVAEVEGGSEPAWTINPTTVALTSFTVDKINNYIGLKTHIRLSFTTNAAAIDYESRVYLVFPYEYGPTMGSTPVTCYLNQVPLKSLYCTVIGERQLEITGFDPTFAAGDLVEIEVFGVEQPYVADSEDFIIGVDSDNDRSIIDETSVF